MIKVNKYLKHELVGIANGGKVRRAQILLRQLLSKCFDSCKSLAKQGVCCGEIPPVALHAPQLY